MSNTGFNRLDDKAKKIKDQASMQVDSAANAAKGLLEQVAEQYNEAIKIFAEQGQKAYKAALDAKETTRNNAAKLGEEISTQVRSQPLMAMVLVGVVGLVVGRLMGGGGRSGNKKL